jgi:hypothetical protein
MNDEQAAEYSDPGVSFGQFMSGAARQSDLQDPEIAARAERVGQTGTNIAMPFGKLIAWLNGPGQFDALLDSQGNPVFDANFNMETGVGTEDAEGVQGGGPGEVTAAYQPEFPRGEKTFKATSWQTPSPEQAAREAIEKEPLLKAQMQYIDRSMPWASQSQQAEAAKALAVQNWVKNTAGIEKAHVTGESNERIAAVKAQAQADARDILEAGKNNRALQSTLAKLQIAKDRNNQSQINAEIGALKTIMGTLGANKPGMLDNPQRFNETVNELLKGQRLRQQPQQQAAPGQPVQAPVTNAQPAESDKVFLRAHPDKAAAFDKRFGAGAASSVLGQ